MSIESRKPFNEKKPESINLNGLSLKDLCFKKGDYIMIIF
jgi:hypothetical protein